MTSTSDAAQGANGTITLRQALSQAEDFSSHDGATYTIQFDPSLAGRTIDLATVGDSSWAASAIAIPAGVSLVIDGAQAPGLTIERASGATDMRLFYVKSGATLTIDALTLSGGVGVAGNGPGGAGGGGQGGGILNRGRLTLDGVTLTDNTAQGGDGRVGSSSVVVFGNGGGGTTTPGATAPGGFGGGIGSYEAGGGGAGMGGAVFNDAGASLVIKDSVLNSNVAVGGAGAAGKNDGQPGGGYGGAIFNYDGALTLIGDSILDNSVQAGPTSPDGQSGLADGEGVYSYQDSSGQAVLNATNTIVGENHDGANDIVNNGGVVEGSNIQAATTSGLPSELVQPIGLILHPSDAAVAVGQTFSLSGQFLFSELSGPTRLSIDWGDGTPTAQVDLPAGLLSFGPITHVYNGDSWSATGDHFTITATITDTSANNPKDDTFTASTSVQVDAAPVVLTPVLSPSNPFLDGSGGVLSPVQTIATFTDPAGLAQNATPPYSATVAWGDGSTSTATVDNGGLVLQPDGQTYAIRLAHAYPNSAATLTYSVAVQVSRSGGVATIAGLPARIVTIAPAYNLNIAGNRSISSTGGLTDQTTVNLQGELPAPGLRVTIIDATSNQTFADATVTPNGDGTASFSETLQLTPVAHRLEIVVSDPASNAQSTATYTVIVDQTAPTVTRIVPASAASQTPVDSVSLTLDEPGSLALASGTFTLTYNGQVVADASNNLSIAQSSPTVFQIKGLGDLATAEGQYVLTLSGSAVTDLAGNPLAASVSTRWIIDQTDPTSQVQPLPKQATSDVIPLTVTAADVAPSSGVVPSGVTSLTVYVSKDNGPFTRWETVPAGDGQTVLNYTAEEGHQYAFRSIATDAAGNVESKAVYAEAGVYVPDMTPPTTEVTSATPDPTTAQFAVTVNGTDAGGSGLVSLAVYVQVDGGPAHLIARVPAGSPNAKGVYSATLTYQAVADGESHSYRFLSEGTDGAGNTEATISALGGLAAAASPRRSLLTSALFAVKPLAATGILVQGGAVERSFIQTVDVQFNQGNVGALPPLTTLIAEDRIELIQHPLDGSSTALRVYKPSLDPGMFSVIDHAIESQLRPIRSRRGGARNLEPSRVLVRHGLRRRLLRDRPGSQRRQDVLDPRVFLPDPGRRQRRP